MLLMGSNMLDSPQQPDCGLAKTTCIRDIYRALIKSGRSYAAFTDSNQALLDCIPTDCVVLDPMSGYGRLMEFASMLGIRSYSVEYNLPQYLWQVLCRPSNAIPLLTAISVIEEGCGQWPEPTMKAAMSDQWFTPEGLDLVESLYEIICKRVYSIINADSEELALALLLPFSGRFACYVPGDISAHSKRGGISILSGWQEDFVAYLIAIRDLLTMRMEKCKCLEQAISYGDARSHQFPEGRFGGMLTSPPYPNHRDFETMFGAENELLHLMRRSGTISIGELESQIIGSNFVRERKELRPRSQVANEFIDRVCSTARRSKVAAYDDAVYYIPYLINYFRDIEDAYCNVSKALAPSCLGYIIVVNNTHRNEVIPVSDVVMEIWRSLGFDSTIYQKEERFHVGSKNPRAKGLRARHTEYIVRISR